MCASMRLGEGISGKKSLTQVIMDKNRLEAFSDGVFAIVITLLVLDIKIPHIGYQALPGELVAALPSIASYVLSFIVIGLYWAFHHFYVDKLKKIDGTILFLNILTLLLISFMPFPTSLMGAYPLTPIPVLMYGLTLIATNLVGLAIIYYMHRHPYLVNEKYAAHFFKELPVYFWVNIPYLIALAMAFAHPAISYFMFVGILVAVSINLWMRLDRQAR